MKKIIKILLIAMLIGGGITTENQVKAQSVSVSLSVFQKSLSPYGRWVSHGTYGQVWIASERNFTPYETNGHWAYTDYGWTWVSDYDWGWAPFHYGRWNWEPSLGWYWIPDYDWGPAWVAWRNSGDYYGWAPLAPGLNISVGDSYATRIPSGRWVFAPRQYINSPSISRYYVPRTKNVTIIKNTTIVNNIVVKNNVHVAAGPRREDVERVNHTKIKTYTVSNSSRPGKTVINKNTVNVYRPVVNKTTIVNNNNKTVVNKNTNKTTVNKNSNNTTVNKNKSTVNKNKTTVNKNTNNKTVKKSNSTTVNNKKKVQNNTTVNKNNNNKTVNTNKKTVNKAPKDNRVAENKRVNSSDKQTTLKKSQPVKSKPDVNSANKNKPQEKSQVQKQKQNVPDSNKNGGKK